MNEKEVAEIRRRFRADKSNITTVRGCYVNEKREIVSEFNQSLAFTSNEEAEQILSLLKKVLSGTLGKNLMDIDIDTKQVINGEEHKLLMTLRQSSLKDHDAVQGFYQRVIGELNMEGCYMILLAHDAYDVPYRSKDGETQSDASDEVFSYLVCAVCPLKLTKPALGYYPHESRFKNIAADSVICPPELGFLFPAFDDRRANIYGALYYTKNLSENHKEFVDTVFHSEIPMPAAVQKETFQAILSDAIADDCSMEVVQAVHYHLSGMIAEHKENKETEVLRFGKDTVKGILQDCGVSQEHTSNFEKKYDEAFGEQARLNPIAVVDLNQLEVSTPDVSIKVSPERRDLIQTRIIGGTKYILIRADEGVEVNGVSICIADKTELS